MPKSSKIGHGDIYFLALWKGNIYIVVLLLCLSVIEMPKTPEERYEKRLNKFRADKKTIKENKEIILKYLEDCKRGMNRKKVGTSRRYKYLLELPKFSKEFNKPFTKIEVKDIEQFLDNSGKSPFKRVVLKTFGKWLRRNNYNFPDVSNIDASEPIKDISALTKEEVQAMADLCKIRDQAIIWFLFDSGARAEEFLNVTHQDLTKKENPDGRGHYYVVRFRHEHSKTKGRTISLPIATPFLDRYLKTLKDIKPNGQFFDITYNGLKKMLQNKGKEALNKHIWPHLMRHSSATYYVTKLNYGSFCYRYGWTITSKEPKRYVDRSGLAGEEEKTAVTIQNDGYLTLKKENEQLQERLALVQERLEQTEKRLEAMPKIMELKRFNKNDVAYKKFRQEWKKDKDKVIRELNQSIKDILSKVQKNQQNRG